jgi:hypothetical protein
MIIQPKTLSQCVKLFKSTKHISTALLMRKFKLSFESALEICQIIEKRFPNIWREGREEFNRELLNPPQE